MQALCVKNSNSWRVDKWTQFVYNINPSSAAVKELLRSRERRVYAVHSVQHCTAQRG